MNKKSLLPCLAACVILAIFSALCFETLHTNHEEHCHEQNCPICFVLQLLHFIKTSLPHTAPTTVIFITFFYIYNIILSAHFLVPVTLVKQKIKLVI